MCTAVQTQYEVKLKQFINVPYNAQIAINLGGFSTFITWFITNVLDIFAHNNNW